MATKEQFKDKESLLPTHAKGPSLDMTRALPLSNPQDSIRAKYSWLAIYFALNLALTLYNKSVMGKVKHTHISCWNASKHIKMSMNLPLLTH